MGWVGSLNSDNKQSCCLVERTTDQSRIQKQTQNINETISETHSNKSMVLIKGRKFLMGTNDREGFHADQEGPVKDIVVDDFYIDRFAVTNANFSKFVKETNYKTEAERFGSSFVFHLLLTEQVKQQSQQIQGSFWWYDVKGAYWAKPEGPESTIKGRENHPVVHVSWNDAIAYCQWSGKRLPTEVEWEYAARGGLEQKKYPWGNELTPEGAHVSNIWQGKFPNQNTQGDGFIGTAPVNHFPPNQFGLYNVSGNVWEWCQNNFQEKYASPQNSDAQSHDSQTYKTVRGGSYLCHHSYCNRYRVAARTANTIESSTGNMGFRCAQSVE